MSTLYRATPPSLPTYLQWISPISTLQKRKSGHKRHLLHVIQLVNGRAGSLGLIMILYSTSGAIHKRPVLSGTAWNLGEWMEELGRTKFLLFALVGIKWAGQAHVLSCSCPPGDSAREGPSPSRGAIVSSCGRLRSVMGTFRNEMKVFVRVFL